MDPSTPISITGVQVHGHIRTKETFFETEFAGIHRCRNIEDLYNHLSEVNDRLQSLGIFEGIETNIRIVDDINGTPSSSQRKQPRRPASGTYPIAIDVIVKEVGVPFLKMESYVRSGGGSSSSGATSSSFSSKGDIGCQIQGALRNSLGYGEITKLAVGRSTTGGREFILDCTIPNFITLSIPSWYPAATKRSTEENVVDNISTPFALYVAAKKIEENPSYFVSYRQIAHSLSGEMSSRDGAHKLSAELAVRDEIPTVQQSGSSIHGASAGVLGLINSSAKSAIKYVFTHDNRDVPASPSSGSYFQSTVELATPPFGPNDGSAQFIRTDVSGQTHVQVARAYTSAWQWVCHSCGWVGDGNKVGAGKVSKERAGDTSPRSHGIVASMAGNVGILWPLPTLPISRAGSNSAFRAYLTDRYHGGGPLSLRGFEGYGIGPRATPTSMPSALSTALIPSATATTPTTHCSAGEALGGYAKLNGLLLLSAPLHVAALGKDAARTFVFLNVGSVGMGWSRQPSSPFFGHLRASVGSGIAVTVGNNVRFELSYAVPVMKATHDVVKPFQIGVGLSMS